MGCGFSRQHVVKTNVSSFDRELLDLKIQRDSLQQYEQRLSDSLKNYIKLARRLVAENQRQQALVVLQVKHALQKSIEKAQNMRFNLEQVLSEIELKQIETDYVLKLRTGTKLLQSIQKTLSIEEIEHLLEETKEAIEFQNKVTEVLGSFSLMEIDESCEEELEQLETAMFPPVPKRLEKTMTPQVTENMQVKSETAKEYSKQESILLPS
ncbi:Charged multivesicular body protein 6 [Galdieria sulphuraria]|uniref:Charged multivesicular body protein 6 n=1 Tax=Galdieria sulphuraria TaxID=130081 RepID=M2WRV2_GALSU|nr:charged multivesicular body protein 6 [Galdieria sulphuraria]EME26555.1 charged multivesicular body protein 6 [Galdieria sulphuraria]GJD07359.1 Charged multivesicular body protein 6 [Galdieria sulphuraria]|eukprot:XP_005703075.1 charged multivesicular body protein 6 [Galdieria sulphuraria]